MPTTLTSAWPNLRLSSLGPFSFRHLEEPRKAVYVLPSFWIFLPWDPLTDLDEKQGCWFCCWDLASGPAILQQGNFLISDAKHLGAHHIP